MFSERLSEVGGTYHRCGPIATFRLGGSRSGPIALRDAVARPEQAAEPQRGVVKGGCGLGTKQQLAHLFHLYRGESFPAISPSYAAAHSVYLEMAAELGIVAAALYFAAIAWIVATCAIAVSRRRRGVHFPAIAVAASVLIGLHSTVDFGAQVPGIAITYAALLGIGYAEARPRSDDRDDAE